MISLDETWAYLDDSNNPRVIYNYEKDGEVRSNFILQGKEPSHPKSEEV